MKLSRSFFPALAVALFLTALPVQASYYATCELKAALVWTGKHKSGDFKRFHARFRVLAYGKGQGHNKRHCAKFVDRNLQHFLIRAPWTMKKRFPRPGSIIRIGYRYSDGLGPRGVIRSESWRYLGLFKGDLKNKAIWVSRGFLGGRQCGLKNPEISIKKIEPNQSSRGITPILRVKIHQDVCKACGCPAYSYRLYLLISPKLLKKARSLGYQKSPPPRV